jgi:hypothetical protein
MIYPRFFRARPASRAFFWFSLLQTARGEALGREKAFWSGWNAPLENWGVGEGFGHQSIT